MIKIVFLLVVIACVGANIVIVADHNNTRVRAYSIDTFPALHPRIVSLKGIRLEQVNDTRYLDVAQFIATTYGTAAIYFGYYHKVSDVPANGLEDASSIKAAAFAFLLETYVVFEFDDRNGIPGFQNGTSDLITGHFNLANGFLQWKDISFSSETITTNGTSTKVFMVTLETKDEVFSTTFTIAGATVQTGNVTINPTTMKIDYTIKWFTDLHVQALWTTGPSNAETYPNAKVGMINILAAGFAHQSTIRNGTGRTGLGLGNQAGFNAFFDWETDVTVDGVTNIGGVHHYYANITSDASTSNVSATWESTAIVFSFNGSRPASVVWDPEFGADIDYDSVDPEQTENDSSSLVPIYMVCLLLIFNFVF